MSHDHMQVEEEVTEFIRSGSRSARRASELQCLGDIHSVCWADATWPDNRYVASDSGKVNTADDSGGWRRYVLHTKDPKEISSASR